MSMKINCSILTHERVIYEGMVDFIVVQSTDGELGFLYNHTPLIAELGIGEARLRTTERADYFYIDGGFVEIKDNELILLAESAIEKEELSKNEVEGQIREIREQGIRDLGQRLDLEVELKKLKAQLRVASR
jgi:F-type H+-transporting ATPase subunit epsilon